MHFTFSIILVRFFYHLLLIFWCLFSATVSATQHQNHHKNVNKSISINLQHVFFLLLSLLKSLVVHGISLFNIFSFGCFMLLFRCITFINRMNYCLINIAHKLYWIGNIFINKTVFQSLLVCLPI